MIYVYECEKHGDFELILPLRKWDDHKPCPKCKKSSQQVHRPQAGRNEFVNPIVVHVAADGAVRFPGRADARLPKGFARRELKTIREVERFERQMNTKLRDEAEQHNQREHEHFEAIRKRNRSELRQAMQRMSPLGRDFAQLAMRINDERKRKSSEVGFHCVILHNDSAKEPWIDKETGWKRKYF